MSPFCWLLLEQDHIAIDELIQLFVKFADHFAYLLIQPTQALRGKLVYAILTIRKLLLHHVHVSTGTCLCGFPTGCNFAIA
jgi:hypothetical protein